MSVVNNLAPAVNSAGERLSSPSISFLLPGLIKCMFWCFHEDSKEFDFEMSVDGLYQRLVTRGQQSSKEIVQVVEMSHLE